MTSSYGRLATPGDRQRINESRRVKILIGIVIGLVVLLFLQRKSHQDATANDSSQISGHQQFLSQWEANAAELHTVYAITPTYARAVQKAELTRISHVVQLSPNIHWIIVEDATTQSRLVRRVISQAGLEYRTTILNEATPTDRKQKVPNYEQPRGVSQRNVALQWVRDHVAKQPGYKQSVVFFMDDDNTYTVELFREMSRIEPGRVGVWPVGLVGGLMVEKPVLDPRNDSLVVGFNSQWRPERPFPIDMAGFAISVNLLMANPEAKFSYSVERGYQESEILRRVTTMDRLQPMANKCRDILVWHTRTELPKLGPEEKLNKANIRSNDGMEVR